METIALFGTFCIVLGTGIITATLVYRLFFK